MCVCLNNAKETVSVRELAKTEGLYQVSKFHLSAIRPLWIPRRGTGVPGRTARYVQLHKPVLSVSV